MERVGSADASFSIDAALGFATKCLLKNFWFLLILHLVVGFIPAALASLVFKSGIGQQFLMVALQSFLMGGFLSILLSLVDGKETHFFVLLSRLNQGWSFILGYILVTVISGLGFVLLLAPGIIVLLSTCFYGLVMAEHDCGVRVGISRSLVLTHDNLWKLLGFFCVLLLVSIPVALAVTIAGAPIAAASYFIFHAPLSGLLMTAWTLCIPPILIFWELAWAHCYRQITPRSDGPINSLNDFQRSAESPALTDTEP